MDDIARDLEASVGDARAGAVLVVSAGAAGTDRVRAAVVTKAKLTVAGDVGAGVDDAGARTIVMVPRQASSAAGRGIGACAHLLRTLK
jgi:hypothetical protein